MSLLLMDAKLNSLIQRLEAATAKLEGLASGSATTSSPAPGPGASHPALIQFDALISGPASDFIQKSSQVGGLVQDQVLNYSPRQLHLKKLFKNNES